MEEDSNNIIFFIQNLNPDMERDVIIEFMTVEGAAIGISMQAQLLSMPFYYTLYSFQMVMII